MWNDYIVSGSVITLTLGEYTFQVNNRSSKIDIMFADQTAGGIMEIRDWLVFGVKLSMHNLDISANINKDIIVGLQSKKCIDFVKLKRINWNRKRFIK